MKVLLAGDAIAGGCDIIEGQGDWHCKLCTFEWYDITDPAKIAHLQLLHRMNKRDPKEELRKQIEQERIDAEKRAYWRSTIKHPPKNS